MNKKAAEHMFGKLITWAALIVFLIIILLVVFGEKGLLRGVADVAIGLQDRILPQRTNPLKVEGDPTSVKVAQSIADIMKMDKYKDSKQCIVKIDADTKDAKDNSIIVDNSNERIEVRKKEWRGEQQLFVGLSEELCLLKVKPFYNCYLAKTEGLRYDCGENMEITSKFDIKVENIAQYIYKTKTGKACIIPITGKGEFIGMDLNGCSGVVSDEEGRPVLDDDCVDQIKTEVGLCGLEEETDQREDKENN